MVVDPGADPVEPQPVGVERGRPVRVGELGRAQDLPVRPMHPDPVDEPVDGGHRRHRLGDVRIDLGLHPDEQIGQLGARTALHDPLRRREDEVLLIDPSLLLQNDFDVDVQRGESQRLSIISIDEAVGGKVSLIDDFNTQSFFVTHEFHLARDFLQIRILFKCRFDIFFDLLESLCIGFRRSGFLLLFTHLFAVTGFCIFAVCGLIRFAFPFRVSRFCESAFILIFGGLHT